MMLRSEPVGPRLKLGRTLLFVFALVGGACEKGGTSNNTAVVPDAGPAPRSKAGVLPEVTFGDGPIARVNGVEIPRKAFDNYYNRFRISMHKHSVLYPVGGADAVMSRVAKRLVAEEVVRQEAKKAGITASEEKLQEAMADNQARLKRDAEYAEYHRELGTTPEMWRAEAEVDVLKDELVYNVLKVAYEVPEEEIQALYKEREKELRHPAEAKLARIRFDIAAEMSGDHTKIIKQQALKVRDALKKGAKFEEAAKNFSQGSSADKGGLIGWIPPNGLPPKIAEVIWKTKVGQTTDVLEDERGFYIFKVLAFRDAGVEPYEDVRSQLLLEVRQKRQIAALEKAMDGWRQGAKIEILIPELEAMMTRTSTSIPEIPDAPAGPGGPPKPMGH
jgi:peptidyl-prolyl cis-trans isomerase C